MPVSIPLLTSENNYRLLCPIDDETIAFDVRWNSRDAAWYVDMYEADDTVIAINVKLVLGVNLARRSQHDFFKNHLMKVEDTANTGRDAGYDDMNTRVMLLIQNGEDLL